jgi:hypothetical protein
MLAGKQQSSPVLPPQPHARLVAAGELDAGGLEGGPRLRALCQSVFPSSRDSASQCVD